MVKTIDDIEKLLLSKIKGSKKAVVKNTRESQTSPIKPWVIDAEKSMLKLDVVVSWGWMRLGRVTQYEYDEIVNKLRREFLLGGQSSLGFYPIGEGNDRGYHSSYMVTLEASLEGYYKTFFDASNLKAIAPRGNSANENSHLFKNRKDAASARLRELRIYPLDDAPIVSDAEDDRVFRDIELRLLGAKSNSLLFYADCDDGSKHYPWEKGEDGLWVAKLSTLDIDRGGESTKNLAARMQQRLQTKYGMDDIAIRGNTTSLQVYANSEEDLRQFSSALVKRAGRGHESHIDSELMNKIVSMTEEVEVIDEIEINLGVGGANHDPYEDAISIIGANGKRLELHIEGNIGSDLCKLIQTTNSTTEIKFAPQVKVNIKVPPAVAKAAKLGPWHFYEKGVFGIGTKGESAGGIEYTIFTGNIHEVAKVLSESFNSLPKFGFDALKDLDGVRSVEEFIEARNYRG